MLGNHSLRATEITAYLKNGGTLEKPPPWQTMRRRTRPSSTTVGAIDEVERCALFPWYSGV
jgi:hypothetical protein